MSSSISRNLMDFVNYNKPFLRFNPVSNNGQNFLIAIASLNHESSSCLPDQQLQHFSLFAVSNYIIITDIDHSFIF